MLSRFWTTWTQKRDKLDKPVVEYLTFLITRDGKQVIGKLLVKSRVTKSTIHTSTVIRFDSDYWVPQITGLLYLPFSNCGPIQLLAIDI